MESTGASSCELHISGHKIFFPHGKKPFPAQLAVISKVLQALKEKKNALIESPTGTGKVRRSCLIFLCFLYFSRP
jgi:Rad3-related DNA helicase